MAGEWTATTLGESVRFVSGGTPSKGNRGFWGGNTPWISAKDMKTFWVDGSEDMLTDEGASAASSLVPEGTTLLLVRGMTLHNDIPIVRVRRPSAFNQDVKAVLPKPNVLGDYVPYLLLGRKAALSERVDAAGHGTGRLALDALHSIPVQLPDLVEQSAIANLLGSLDDKIRLNMRMATTLEEMARALFKSWFVDFDPVRAKAEDSRTSLFPEKFGEDGLPEGWTRESLRPSLVEPVTRGVAPSYVEEGLAVVNQKCIRNGQINFTLARRHDQNSRRVPDAKLLQVGDILINSTGAGTLGRVAQIRRLHAPATVDTHVTIVRPSRDDHWSSYLGLQLVSREAEIERLGDGSTGQTELARDAIGRLTVVVPPDEIVRTFADTTTPMLASADTARTEVATLSKLRAAILPKLISGELRIKDVQSAVEAA